MKIRLVLSFVLLAAVSSRALGNEIYKFDQSRSTIGFTVHQFLGTTHGKFPKFDGKIEIDREHPEKSSVVAESTFAASTPESSNVTTICGARNFLTSQSFPK